MQPDIAAPGVNILSAVPDGYKFMSGTSMSTPIVSGIVGLIRQTRPDWSPAAIRSALVTTGSHSKTIPNHRIFNPYFSLFPCNRFLG